MAFVPTVAPGAPHVVSTTSESDSSRSDAGGRGGGGAYGCVSRFMNASMTASFGLYFFFGFGFDAEGALRFFDGSG